MESCDAQTVIPAEQSGPGPAGRNPKKLSSRAHCVQTRILHADVARCPAASPSGAGGNYPVMGCSAISGDFHGSPATATHNEADCAGSLMQNTGQCPRKISARNTQARNPRAHSDRGKQTRRTCFCSVATRATKPHEATRQCEAGERACTSLGCRLFRGRGAGLLVHGCGVWLHAASPRRHLDHTRI